MAKTLFVVGFHDNSWGAQESRDTIIGVYSTYELADEAVDKVTELADYNDDYPYIDEVELDEPISEIEHSDVYYY